MACDGGSVSISRSIATTVIDGKEGKKGDPERRLGVPPEVRKRAEAITAGKQNDRQTPEEALADLEMIRCVKLR